MAKKQIKKIQDGEKGKTTKATVKAAEIKETKVVEEPVVEKKVEKKVVKKATKKEVKTTLIVEHQGKQVAEKDMVAAVKKAWTKTGNKVGDIKSLTLYVKPEENAVYYVINDTETGSIAF